MRKRHTIKQIQLAVSLVMDVKVRDMKSPSRLLSIVRARHIGMYLARLLTKQSYTQIARAFGRSDHTSAIHADRKIVENYDEFRDDILAIVEKL